MRAKNSDEEIEEERRLAYVGITRAKKKLVITTAATRMFQGQTTRNRRSRFLSEIPPELIDKNDETVKSYRLPQKSAPSKGAGYSAGKSPLPPSAQPKKTEPFTLKAGDRVRHYKFGEGKILSVSPMGGDTLVEIDFDNGNTKRLMASFIKLEKLN